MRFGFLRVSGLMLAGTVALSACGGGSHSSIPALNGSTGTAPGTPVGSAPATFTFTFPKSTASAGRRSPKYLSSATKSVTLHVTDTKNHGDHSDIYANVPSALKAVQIANFANLTGNPNTPGQCGTDPSNAGNYKCTATFQVPIGDDTMTLTSWDATGGTGNALSQQISTQWVQQGVTNTFAISLDANAATIAVSGSGSCQNGLVGASFGSVGTTPVSFSVAYTDPAGKTIVSPGQPTLAVTTTGVTGGTIGVSVNQAAQTYTLTPSATGVSGTINVSATPASATDGLSFTRSKSYTFATGVAPPAHNFLAAVEQFGVGSGAVDLFNVSLGGSGSADTISAFSPATLATTNSNGGSGPPDVDNPLDLVFDSTGDLLIGNGGTTTGSPVDDGNLACVPVGAIATGQNTSTTITTNVDDPVGIAYDSRDGSVALANNPTSAPVQLDDFLLTGNYTAAASGRDLIASGYGSFGITNVPSLPAGTYAITLTTGLENDPAHNTGSAKIAIVTPTSATTSTETDILPSGAGTNCTANPCAIPATYGIDIPHQIAWDAANGQLVIANNSAFHKLLTFYTTGGTQVMAINTGLRNDKVAVSPDGHVAVSGVGSFGFPQVKVYDNTAARNAVIGPIPFNGTTTSCGSTYIYGDGVVVNSLAWLSNTKLLVALQASTTGTMNANNGLYIYDITASAVPTGFDDVSCSTFAAAPKQTGFMHLTNKPLGTAFKP